MYELVGMISFDGNFVNLFSGNYIVIVMDGNDCFGLVLFIIDVLVVVSLMIMVDLVSCNGLVDGVVIVVVSGGIVFYIYLWSDI